MESIWTRSAIGLAGFLLVAQAQAAEANVAEQRIMRLATGWGGEGFYVSTEGALPDGASCGSGNVFYLENNYVMGREIVALLMSAMQTDTPVDMFISGCVGGSMKLKAVAMSRR